MLLKQVPDVVLELVIEEDGAGLDEDEVKFVTNEADQQALQQAVLLKERHGGRVDVWAVGGEEATDALAEAAAKGADSVSRVPAAAWQRRDNVKLSAHLAGLLKEGRYDLVLTGTQAVDDVNGSLGGLLSARLALPYVGGLAAVAFDPGNRRAVVKKEYPGGVLAVLEVATPAVLGIQSAERPLAYAPVSRVVQAKRTMKVRELPGALPAVTGLSPMRLARPQPKARAEMIEGEADAVAVRVAALLKERGLA